MVSTPYIFHVEVSLGPSFDSTLNQIKTWLDANEVQLAHFRAVDVPHSITFEFGFHSEAEARLFEIQFPKIRLTSAH